MEASRMALVPAPPAARPTWLEVMDRGGELAEVIANTEFVPRGLRGNQPAILAAILYGHEIGLEPMTSLGLIAVIDGRPTLAAEAQRALILGAGHELWVEESTATRATVAGRRREGKQTSRVTWTLDDAKRAGIAGRANWQRYPRQMLVARASAELARQLFADVIRGLAATEELEGVVDAELVGETETPPAKTTTRRRRRPAAPSTPQPEPPLPGEAEPPKEPQEPKEAQEPEPPIETIAGPDPMREPEPEPEPAPGEDTPAPPDPASEAQFRKLFALFADVGITDRDERLAYSEKVLERPITSSRELTAVDATRLIEALEQDRTLPPGEQAVIDEARELFDARDVPPLPGEEGGTQ